MVTLDPLAFALIALGFLLMGAVGMFYGMMWVFRQQGFHLASQMECLSCRRRIHQLARPLLWHERLVWGAAVCDDCITEKRFFDVIDVRTGLPPSAVEAELPE